MKPAKFTKRIRYVSKPSAKLRTLHARYNMPYKLTDYCLKIFEYYYKVKGIRKPEKDEFFKSMESCELVTSNDTIEDIGKRKEMDKDFYECLVKYLFRFLIFKLPDGRLDQLFLKGESVVLVFVVGENVCPIVKKKQ